MWVHLNCLYELLLFIDRLVVVHQARSSEQNTIEVDQENGSRGPNVLAEDATSSNESSSGAEEVFVKTVEDARVAVAVALQSYRAHELFISLLRTEDLDDLRTARGQFSSVFPLPPPVWLEWMGGEVRISGTSEDSARIANILFPAALRDYLSVEIAVAYIEFEGGHLMKGEITLSVFAACFESLVGPGRAGSVYRDGVKVWRAYRNALTKYWIIPLDVHAQLLTRQLSLPLAGNEVKQTAFDDRTVMASTPSSDITAVLEAFENKLMIVGSNLEDFNGVRLEAVVMQFGVRNKWGST
jgi:hypothetical protein